MALSLSPWTPEIPKRDGNSKSSPLTIEEELNEMLRQLDQYELNCGFPATVNENTKNIATSLMNTDFSDFRATQDECANNASALTQYALNLQRIINKEKTIVHWADEKIKKVIAPNLRNQQAYGWEERKMCAISSDDIAQRLNYIKITAELRLMRIESMYFAIKNMADKFSGLAGALRGIR